MFCSQTLPDMKKEEIVPWDWQRILFGQAPAEFLLEVFIRTIIIYLALLLILRLLGKRMDGQLTLTEMAVMITFGAIVSVPMQLPDRGILLGIVALLVAAAFQRGLNWLNVKSADSENITQGTMSLMVKDGLLDISEMDKAGLSKQNLFSTLRGRKIFNLGKVRRLYFEACGIVSVYQFPEERPGLPVLPSDEIKLIEEQVRVDNQHIACKNCGFVENKRKEKESCSNCGEIEWVKAII